MILLYVLVFVAIGNWLAAARTTDWDEPLWVDVYPVNADGSANTQAYIDELSPKDFEQIEAFFTREAARYEVAIERPFRLELGPQIPNDIPKLPETQSILGTILWSLRMRWFALGIDPGEGRPRPDIKLFALYYDESDATILDRSTALERGLIAIAKLFAGRASSGPNQIVMAHELLHTLGASDKYDLATNLPIYPHGFAQPDRRPRYPQRDAELMAGRIPIDGQHAEMPAGLGRAVVGSATALEIGWIAPH
ncbi:MAG TPA: hypothetical protein VIV14_11085 [Gammaproteobacteria bacterium]